MKTASQSENHALKVDNGKGSKKDSVNVQCRPRQEALQSFHKAGIGVEVMNTASACRTFNVLVSENRYVIAGLLQI